MPNRVLDIIREGDRLFAQVTQVTDSPLVGPKFEMFAENEESFFVKATGGQIRFDVGPEGRATSLAMHRVGGEPIRAARLC